MFLSSTSVKRQRKRRKQRAQCALGDRPWTAAKRMHNVRMHAAAAAASSLVFSHSFSLSFYRGPRGISHHWNETRFFFCIRGRSIVMGSSRGDSAIKIATNRRAVHPYMRLEKEYLAVPSQRRKENKTKRQQNREARILNIVRNFKIISSFIASRSSLDRRIAHSFCVTSLISILPLGTKKWESFFCTEHLIYKKIEKQI